VVLNTTASAGRQGPAIVWYAANVLLNVLQAFIDRKPRVLAYR
jgi:hypothetical protein